ncbi:MAG: hypothetical protein ABS68_08925 [Niastella sp. SCN 39-18]|nr:hypothetical protein [Sphingobacteriales bacterium]ODT52228.1 MAG: hypothetical protein ABS68_08925 [Niastella sp. SCN 39-18]OJW10487.1 MAG: hypothetical protein BGO53_09960 [Sphingobacteriales bacterium 39-19]
MSNKFKDDPENYYKMSEPHESADKANEALQKFYEKVSEARKEFKIADILIVTKDSVRYEDGNIGQFMQHSQYGNQLNGVSMAAYAYGQLQAEDRERINKLIAGKR